MPRVHRASTTLLLTAALAIAGCASPPTSSTASLAMARSPEEVGISSAQLARIEEVTKENIKAGLVPGAVILVQRKGKVAWFTALGDRDRAGGSPMRTDSIFRIYSMTKPIVSVVIMMLVEEGRMQIYDPVSKYLPEMAGMKVGVEKTDASGKATLELVAPEREMTIQDLLRHTSGLIYGSRGKSLVNQAYIDAKILDRSVDSKEFVTRVSKLPLRFSPGTRWEYGISVDVLGRVIEVVEGRSLGQVLKARIFDPLGMVDTAFYVPPEKMDRAAQPWPRPGAPPSPRFDVAQNPAFESGGGGLVSTAEDYLRFTQMLLNGGEHNGQRFIGRKMVEFMTSDHTPNLPGRNPSVGFGLGFDVRNTVGATGIPGSVGEYSWSGNAGTMFWIDPKEELIAIFMVQVADGDRIAVRNQFRSMLQSAIRR